MYNAQLNWDDNNTDETATTKFQERCQCKKIQEEEGYKHWKVEECCKAEEAEQRHKAEEEARAHTAIDEKKKCKEAVTKECIKNDLPCEVVTGVKKRSACMGCTKLKEKCKWPAVEIVGGSSKQVMSPWGGKKKKRVRKSTMVDEEVVVEGQKMGQSEARGSDMVAEAICKLTRKLTGQLDMLTNGVLEELQGQLNVLENLVKTQKNISQKMSWHYVVLEDMLEELEMFATKLDEPLEEEDAVEEEDLEEVRGELEELGPIVNLEQEMEEEQ
ncbi:hypothetical protein ID866_9330 [Astraeus odoratus]|nr:hypothetical protein ID866_9330 [Astraeus odoratus]